MAYSFAEKAWFVVANIAHFLKSCPHQYRFIVSEGVILWSHFTSVVTLFSSNYRKPDFGYRKILPFLEKKYRLDPNQLTYGGFSLGGLAATMSLWQTDCFRHVFSLCGSFWYPGVPEYMEQHPLKNQTANIFLLNGKKEGSQHTNRLKNAVYYADQVHQLLSRRANALTVMDDYPHHEQVAERLQQAMFWVNAQLSK